LLDGGTLSHIMPPEFTCDGLGIALHPLPGKVLADAGNVAP